MVFFTCNHCGESAKKPAVEKHYNSKCRGAPIFVSCMDCQKDFRDQEYVEHTKCITEAEKYSGKGYVPKESQNKGQKKQDSWIEIVRSILSTAEYDLNPSIKIIFQRLQTYDNVPRKGAKFENFVSNSMRINKNQAKEVWKILEKELNKLKKNAKAAANNANGNVTELNGDATNGNVNESNEDATKENVEESNGHDETVDTPNLNSESIALNEVNKRKKDKKSKKRSKEDSNIDLENLPENIEVPNEPQKKKKKSKNEEIINDVEVETLKGVETNGNTIESDGKFNWYNIISDCAKDGMSIESLKKKVLKKHNSFYGHDADTNLNKIEKTFKKYFKRSGLNVDNDIIKIN